MADENTFNVSDSQPGIQTDSVECDLPISKDEIQALSNFVSSGGADLEMVDIRDGLSGHALDNKPVTSNPFSDLTGADSDSGSEHLSVSAATSDDESDDSSGDESTQCDDHQRISDTDLGKKKRGGKSRADKKKQKETQPPELNIEVSEEEKQRSMEVGLRTLVGRTSLTETLYPPTKDDMPELPLNHKALKPTDKDKNIIEDMLAGASATKGLEENALKPEIPISVGKNKRKALSTIAREVMKADPTADKRELYRDVNDLVAASMRFRHKPKIVDGDRVWNLNGMKKTLFHHQVDGVGWMCEREREGAIPRGGMLCDCMGLGKTFTTLACILDGRREESEGRAPTLILVPLSARRHWLRQISEGFDTKMLGLVYHWKHDSDTDLKDSPGDLKQYDIVLATHDDVRRSYPSLSILKEFRTDEEKEQWWSERFEPENYESIGLLHKVKWHRIVVDEAHEMRNYKTQLSVSIRALTGDIKWLLTGTPMFKMDFYAYFQFLKVPNFEFVENFCNKFCKYKQGDNASKMRLVDALRPFFHRKTYGSTYFCRPIVPMRESKHTLVTVEFLNIEKVIYDEILNELVKEYNSNFLSPKLQQKCILSTITQLRQFSNHFLIAQKVVKNVVHNVKSALHDETAKTEGFLDRDSSEIWGFIELLANQDLELPDSAEFQAAQEKRISKRGSSEDRIKLKRDCKQRARKYATDGDWEEYASITTKECVECLEKLKLDELWRPNKAPLESLMFPGKKRPRNITGKPGKRKARKTGGMFSRSKEDDEPAENEDKPIDWLPLLREYHLGANWLGSKMTKIRDVIQAWLREDGSNKIVIFTDFLDSQRILEIICEEEDWHYTKISGKMKPSDRDDQIQEFQTNPLYQIMLATYGTGGTAIDLTAANKCILMDGWWNMARDEQAIFRLSRIGQVRDVEFIRFIAKGTLDGQESIDVQMRHMQDFKDEMIKGIMSPTLLNMQEVAKGFVGQLGETKKDKRGCITLIRRGLDLST
ncbi:hypothetical protein PENDEC_c009G00043 [Penicillium decumbens]|uniref:Helicase ATP-binding domain-containing protein n=1 Tax=Penicillium decumbens TaxID=69771 RepID=A0A1V6PCG7_PENDC|nr:hypothetical protein PENDEC_c009G00043 [Penicillium decumbens]